MKITFLGQAGLLFEMDGKKIIVDAYLSNSVVAVNPNNYRRQPIDERFLKMTPDVLIFTHNHLDHYDKETAKHYLSVESQILVLSPVSVFEEVKAFGGKKNNYVCFNKGTSWSEGNILFQAVKAEHSDKEAIGVVISFEGKNYYITGDTLYNEKVFASLPQKEIDVIFLPINGVGNNLNVNDAKRFAERVGAKKVVPMHFGLFDNMTGEELDVPNKIIPTIYKEILL